MKTTLTVRQTCESTGLSRTTIYNLIANGSLKSIKVGRRRLVRIDSLQTLLGGA